MNDLSYKQAPRKTFLVVIQEKGKNRVITGKQGASPCERCSDSFFLEDKDVQDRNMPCSSTHMDQSQVPVRSPVQEHRTGSCHCNHLPPAMTLVSSIPWFLPLDPSSNRQTLHCCNNLFAGLDRNQVYIPPKKYPTQARPIHSAGPERHNPMHFRSN